MKLPPSTLDAIVSVFKEAFATVPFEDLPIKAVLERIRSGHYQEQIQKLRQLPEAEYREAKKRLHAVVFTGKCSDRKQIAKEVKRTKLLVPSNVWVVDLDDLSPERIVDLRDQLKSDGHVCFFFLSPSGKGLKVAVRIDGERHEEEIFEAVQKYFCNTYGVEIDPACKDLLRLCFVSWDPDLFSRNWAQSLPLPEPSDSRQTSLGKDSLGRHSRQTSLGTKSGPSLGRLLLGTVPHNSIEVSEGVQSTPGKADQKNSEKMFSAAISDGMENEQNNQAAFRAACALCSMIGKEAVRNMDRKDQLDFAESWYLALKTAGRTTNNKAHYIMDMLSALKNAPDKFNDNPKSKYLGAIRRAQTLAALSASPPEATSFEDDPITQKLIGLAYQLHLASQTGTWFLGRDKAGEALGLNAKETRHDLDASFKLAVELGVFEIVVKGKKGLATEYRYITQSIHNEKDQIE